MKNFFFKTIETAAVATVMLAGNLNAQGGAGSKGWSYGAQPGYHAGTNYEPQADRYVEFRHYGEPRHDGFRLNERRRFLIAREREIERELEFGRVSRFRGEELRREEHRTHEELEHMPRGYGYR